MLNGMLLYTSANRCTGIGAQQKQCFRVGNSAQIDWQACATDARLCQALVQKHLSRYYYMCHAGLVTDAEQLRNRGVPDGS